MKKKVLIITYYWPPAGGPGVQRVLKFAKYLPQFGWEPIILTIDNGDYHATDESLLNDIPNSIKVYKAKSFSALDLYKKLNGGEKKISSFELTKKEGGLKFKLIKWIRANLFIPDARGGWNKAAVKLGLEIIKNENPSLIFTSSPPHSLQLIGKKLKEKSGLKWVADFRDPWTDAFWDKELPRLKVFQKYNMYLEKKVIKSADSLSAVSMGFIELLKKGQDIMFNQIPNGFDLRDFEKIQYKKSSGFRINYIGSIANSQNPDSFFKSIQNLPREIKEKTEINFYGVFDNQVIESANKYGKHVQFNPYIPHDEAINLMVNSEILLLLIPRDSKGILTGKLYEYLAAKNFILAIAPDDSEIKQTLDLCNSGTTVNFETDTKGIIIEQFELWQQNSKAEVNQTEINKFTREQLTLKLAKQFDRLVE